MRVLPPLFAALAMAFIVYGVTMKRIERPPVDALEERIVTALRLELSKERALRVFPQMDDEAGPLRRRMGEIYRQWDEQNDPRLLDTDLPYLLAREAASTL